MSKADIVYKEMCREIIDNGFSSEGYRVRPHWEDGTPAHTVKKFGIVNRYDLTEEFPAITFRKTFIKSAMDEILWIWQKKSNNIKDLKSHIWDEWADKEGSIGKAYGYQQSRMYVYNNITEEGLFKAFPNVTKMHYHILGMTFYGYDYEPGEKESKGDGKFKNIIAIVSNKETKMTQIDKAIYDLTNSPLSRRIMVSMWNMEDLHEMNLEPCAYSMTFNVTGNKLNSILNQRSQDVLAAGNWNVVQYSLLLMMIAQVTGYEAGELVHVISDCHIYDRHVPIVEELIERPMFPAPKVSLNPNVKNFYDFTVDDLTIGDYEAGPQVKNIPIAI